MKFKYRKSKFKNIIGYSESFIFRARCKYCRSTIKRVYENPSTIYGHTVGSFRTKRKPYSISNSYVSYYGGKVVKCGAHYSGHFYPTKYNKSKDGSSHKAACCECGKTWWSFKINSPQRSIKGVKPQ